MRAVEEQFHDREVRNEPPLAGVTLLAVYRCGYAILTVASFDRTLLGIDCWW